MRYEAHLERSFRRTLDLFLRLRAMRGVDRAATEPVLEPAFDRIETARQARRQIIAGLRKAGAAEEEVAAYEAREAAYDPAASAVPPEADIQFGPGHFRGTALDLCASRTFACEPTCSTTAGPCRPHGDHSLPPRSPPECGCSR